MSLFCMCCFEQCDMLVYRECSSTRVRVATQLIVSKAVCSEWLVSLDGRALTMRIKLTRYKSSIYLSLFVSIYPFFHLCMHGAYKQRYLYISTVR